MSIEDKCSKCNNTGMEKMKCSYCKKYFCGGKCCQDCVGCCENKVCIGCKEKCGTEHFRCIDHKNDRLKS